METKHNPEFKPLFSVSIDEAKLFGDEYNTIKYFWYATAFDKEKRQESVSWRYAVDGLLRSG